MRMMIMVFIIQIQKQDISPKLMAIMVQLVLMRLVRSIGHIMCILTKITLTIKV